MAWPNPVPADARNCMLYGFIRDASGAPAENVAVHVSPPRARAEHGIVDEAGETFGEGMLDYTVEVLTNATGYWEVELRQGTSVRVQIASLSMDVEAMVPATTRQDFTYWAYQPALEDTRQYIADPTNAPTDIDTSVVIHIEAARLPLVLQLFDEIKVYRATSRNGVYAEVTTGTTRLELADGVVFYEHTDEGVDPGGWYKASFYNATRDIDGPLSPTLRADAPDYAQVLTVAELKAHYLFGVDLTDDGGNPYPKSLFEGYLRDAIGWLERELDVRLQPTARTERQDLFARDFQEFEWIQLDHAPILAVDSVEHLVGDNVIWTVPTSWLQVDNESGVIQVVPASGSGVSEAFLLASGSRYAGYSTLIHSRYPGFFRITYRHGFALGTIPAEIKHVIAMKASLGPLDIAGDLLLGAGIASLSVGIDGVHQSISSTSSATNAGYGARVKRYEAELKARLPGLKRKWAGLRCMVAG